jgi:hypothetical protein
VGGNGREWRFCGKVTVFGCYIQISLVKIADKVIFSFFQDEKMCRFVSVVQEKRLIFAAENYKK